MMRGYDKQAALEFMMAHVNRKAHKELASQLESLFSQAIDADMAYMHENNVLDEDGDAGTAYYEDDEAFETIVETLAAQNKLSPEQAVKVAALVDEYMDLQETFLESQGLVDWE